MINDNAEEPCVKKSILGKCLECKSEFVLNDGECQFKKTSLISMAAVTCTTSITSCNTCLTPNYCISCGSSLVPNAQGNQCITNCTINNCMICASSLTCQICSNGYTLQAGNCIQTQLNGCKTYSGSNVCSSCYSGYVPNSQLGTCSLANCLYPCDTCDAFGKCLTCKQPFSGSAFDNGTCFTCPIANCISCNANSLSICAQCAPGYAPNAGNTVCSWGCPSPQCTSCTTSGGVSTCTACSSGYVANGAVCSKCQNAPICTACLASNNAQCTACVAGYYLTTSNTCAACAISTCKVCTPASNGQYCTSFIDSSGLQVYTSTTLTTTPTNFPSVCDTGCASCSSNYPGVCLQCMAGYYIQTANNVPMCFACGSNCMTCQPNSPSTCLSCYSNAYLSGTTCIACNPTFNCLTCNQNATNVCTSCPYGYYLTVLSTGKANCITACPANCLTCFNAQGTTISGLNAGNIACSSCEVGYSLSVTGACLPCVANCRVCTGQYQSVCVLCGPGFYVGTNYTCFQCPSNCLTCTPIGCLTCTPGYNLQVQNSSTICAPVCNYPCAACVNFAPNSCTACIMGFTLNTNNQCVLSSCVTSTSNACENCPMGSYYNQGSCSACGASCARCNPAAPNSCYTCLPGFFMNSAGTCVACGNGCATCSSAYNCLTCASNYTAVSAPVGSNQVTCTACSLPCAECSYNPEQCTSCIKGFTFTGWNCVSNFYYTYTATFSASQNMFFNHYQALINRFTYALQTTNNKAVSVQSIQSDSVSTTITVWMTTVEESNSRKSANEYSNLKFALLQEPDSSLAGMTVTEAKLGFVGGQIYNTYSSTPTFLGIFIPLGIVIIVAIAYFFCSRNDMDLPGSNYIPPAERT